MLCKNFIKSEEISDYPLYDYAQPPDLFTVLEFLLNPKQINVHVNVDFDGADDIDVAVWNIYLIYQS